MTKKQAGNRAGITLILIVIAFFCLVPTFFGLFAEDQEAKLRALNINSFLLLFTSIALIFYCAIHFAFYENLRFYSLDNLRHVYLSEFTKDLEVIVLYRLQDDEHQKFFVTFENVPCVLHIDQSLTKQAAEILYGNLKGPKLIDFVSRYSKITFKRNETTPDLTGPVINWEILEKQTLAEKINSELNDNSAEGSPILTVENLSHAGQQSKSVRVEELASTMP